MGNSVFLRRIILLVATALLLSGGLTFLLFNVVVQQVYVNMQANDLLPIAKTISSLVTESEELGMSVAMHPLLSGGEYAFLGAQLHIYDREGEQVQIRRGGPHDPLHKGPPPDGRGEPDLGDGELGRDFWEPSHPVQGLSPQGGQGLDSLIQPVLKVLYEGGEIVTTDADHEGTPFVLVGVPVYDGDSETVMGAVVFTKRVSDLTSSLRGLQLTLLISALATFVLMLLPVFFIARRLTIPLIQMRDVSLHMAKGDFSRRADEGQKGEIGELAASINRFAGESQRLEKTRQDYVANVSHELRTPIAAIRAMSETLSDGILKTEEKKQRYYTLILRESMRLSRLVNDLLELSRLQAGGVALQKTHFSLGDTLSRVVEVYREMAEDADVTLSLAGDLDSLGTVHSNEDRVEQVLVILLDNAVSHTPEGGRIRLGASRQGDDVLLVEVSNTGAAIPPEDLPYVFDRFYKVDKSHSSGGTGLGLSIAKEIISLLEEEILVDSSPRMGTRFSFTLHRK